MLDGKSPGPDPLPPPQTEVITDVLGPLVGRMAARDETALAALYDATSRRVYGAALRIVRDPQAAEEVVADVYFQAWRQASGYDAERASVRTWLLMMCRSRALDHLRIRQEAVAPAEMLESVEGAPGDPQDLYAAVEHDARLRASLAELTPLQRQLFALAFFRGYSHAEIARHARLPLGSVKSHIRKALARLRAALAPAAKEDTRG